MMEVFRQLEHRRAWGRMLGLGERMGQACGPCQCGCSRNNVLHDPRIRHATPPEMQRTDLSMAVLQLKALGIDNVVRFEFPTWA